MAYIVRWASQEGIHTELAFTRKEDALVSASSAVDRGDKDVKVLDDGKALPHSAFAPKHRKRKKAS
ncbi:MAG TPA: hypothetical protein VL966_06825 [Alphaproteobacteria bacterium]|jgi:hypothetical protein|nr:hypothetical protein [Alphaproteobacteria bacterium]